MNCLSGASTSYVSSSACDRRKSHQQRPSRARNGLPPNCQAIGPDLCRCPCRLRLVVVVIGNDCRTKLLGIMGTSLLCRYISLILQISISNLNLQMSYLNVQQLFLFLNPQIRYQNIQQLFQLDHSNQHR